MSLDKLKVVKLKNSDLTFPWGVEYRINFKHKKYEITLCYSTFSDYEYFVFDDHKQFKKERDILENYLVNRGESK